jgi:PDZ domain
MPARRTQPRGPWASPRRARAQRTALLILLALAPAGCRLAEADTTPAMADATSSASETATAAEQPADPALMHLHLLEQLDRQIDATAARAHIEARLTVDSVLPIAFLGMVAEPDGDVLRVTQIYRDTGADACGLRVGDVLVAFAGKTLQSKSELYREIRQHAPGTTQEMVILRDGNRLVLHAVLGTRWQEDEEDEEQYGDIAPAPFASCGLPVTLDFEEDADGAMPASLEPALGGLGDPPRYVVAYDGPAGVLRQENVDRTGIRFPMALVRGVDADDVAVRVRFRVVGGAQDRAAGIVLRYQDPANYLVARANAVEGDLRIFRAVNGLRRTLPGAVAQIHIDDEAWHTLEFRVDGARVTAVLDGTITATSFDTYFTHGRVGLWTKSDSRTEFDDLSLQPVGPTR